MKVLAKKNIMYSCKFSKWVELGSVLVIIINSESNYSNLCKHGTQLV